MFAEALSKSLSPVLATLFEITELTILTEAEYQIRLGGQNNGIELAVADFKQN
jgi:hypothetical protein